MFNRFSTINFAKHFWVDDVKIMVGFMFVQMTNTNPLAWLVVRKDIVYVYVNL